MGHGGYGKRKVAAAERKKPAGQRRPKTLAIDKKSKATKPKSVSFKNQIRSIERMLRKVFLLTFQFSRFSLSICVSIRGRFMCFLAGYPVFLGIGS